VADRWSARDTVLFGTPAAEPQLAEGFYREAAPAEGDTFVWARGEAELSLTWPDVRDRAAVVDLAPYSGVRNQSAEVRLNGTPVGSLRLNDDRHRYGLSLPAAAQKVGENRLRFLFAQTASPGDDPRNPDRRQLSAAFYALVVGPASDAGLQDLLGRDAPRPFAAVAEGGAPSLVQVGSSVVRYALRLPAGAELRFRPRLHPSARAAAASASLRVTVESVPGQEKEAWSRVIGPREDGGGEVRVSLPGETGAIVRLGLHVGGTAAGDRFAWAVWGAPRVLGRGDAPPISTARPIPPEPARREADALRASLAGANVVLIVLDAARADHFGAYGYPRATTPNVDLLAREGIVFERAYTPAVYTLAAMSSLWTSQYPDRHHAEVSFSARLPKDRLTLAELLTAQGVHTAGFAANSVAGGLNGFDRGFAEFHEVWKDAGSGAASLRDFWVPWVERNRERRFFAYLHFREPHSPYVPPPAFVTRFGPDAPLQGPVRTDPLAQDAWIKDVNQGRKKATPEERDHLVRLYDGNLALADEVVGHLRHILRAAALWDRTVVIVTGDHGEALLEHGWIGHNTQLYEESIHVPLVVRLPGGARSGTRIPALVDHLDVAPTIADVFGVLGKGGSEREFQGRSLLPVLGGAPGEEAIVARTVWDRPRYARRDERFKLIYDTRTGGQELYDLQSDPGETRDVTGSEGLRAAWARQELHLWIARTARRPPAGGEAPPPMTREQCENLKALGYLGSDFKCPDR
jgi:arylsulfatase A-like enzyme